MGIGGDRLRCNGDLGRRSVLADFGREGAESDALCSGAEQGPWKHRGVEMG